MLSNVECSWMGSQHVVSWFLYHLKSFPWTGNVAELLLLYAGCWHKWTKTPIVQPHHFSESSHSAVWRDIKTHFMGNNGNLNDKQQRSACPFLSPVFWCMALQASRCSSIEELLSEELIHVPSQLSPQFQSFWAYMRWRKRLTYCAQCQGIGTDLVSALDWEENCILIGLIWTLIWRIGPNILWCMSSGGGHICSWAPATHLALFIGGAISLWCAIGLILLRFYFHCILYPHHWFKLSAWMTWIVCVET